MGDLLLDYTPTCGNPLRANGFGFGDLGFPFVAAAAGREQLAVRLQLHGRRACAVDADIYAARAAARPRPRHGIRLLPTGRVLCR